MNPGAPGRGAAGTTGREGAPDASRTAREPAGEAPRDPDAPLPAIRCLVADPVTGVGERASRLLRTREEFAPVEMTLPGEDLAGQESKAVEALREHRPDAVFLAVDPPSFDGFRVLEAVPTESRPVIVFLARTDAHAGRAFDVGAVDYLTPPCSPRRLWEAVERVRRRLGREAAEGSDPSSPRDAGTGEWVGEDGGRRVSDRYLTVKQGDVYKLVDLAGLRWAEAARNYVRLHTEDGTYLVRTSLRTLQERLDGPHFARIHRSTLVNVRRIRRVVPLQWGDCRVELDSGEELRMSRTYRDNLL